MDETEKVRLVRLWLLATAVGVVVLFWPGLDAGFLADDLFQISMWEGFFAQRSVFGLYSFVFDDPAVTAEHIRRGTLPWWTVLDWRFAMLRPLSSLTLAVDHWLFGRRPFIHHVHSLLWVFATLGVAYALVRQSLGRAIAAVAVTTFAVDESMAWMVSWLANRCALVCATFGLAALLVHIRRRPPLSSGDTPLGGARRWWLELGLWSLAFAGGEYAACAVAYLGAYELVEGPGRWRDKAASLAPALIPMTIFGVVFVVGGFGVMGATTYIDPFGQPLEYLGGLFHRIPRMLGELWVAIPGEYPRVHERFGDTGLVEWVLPRDGSSTDVLVRRHARLAFAVAVPIVSVTWWLALRWLERHERRTLAWMVLGSCVALVPISAIPPATRSLLLPSFGVAVWVAGIALAAFRAIRQGVKARGEAIRRVALVVFAAAFVVAQIVWEAARSRELTLGILDAQAAYRRFYDNLDRHQVSLTGKHVVVVATPGLVTGIHALSWLYVLDRPLPESWHVLAMGQRPYLVRRHGVSTLEVSSVGNVMHRGPNEGLFRPADVQLSRGAVVDAGLFRAEVVHVQERGPDAILFHFERELDDPELLFLVVGKNGLEPFAVPPIGRTVAVKPPEFPAEVPRG